MYTINCLLCMAALLCLSACPGEEDTTDTNRTTSPASDPAVSNETDHSDELGTEHGDNPCSAEENPCAGAEENPCGGVAEVVDASKIYASANCTMCHGKEMEGSGLGPALSNVAAKWDETELKKYIRDPQKYEDTGNRLTNDPKYVMEMPVFPQSEQDLDALVKWLLTK